MSVITGQGVTAYPLPDEELSPTSKNAVSNEAVCEGLDEIKNTLSHKADVIYDTASGDIASFPDGADCLPVKDLTVAIEPVQSGTGDPSLTNVRPISGWTGANVSRTGKNLLDNLRKGNSYAPQDKYKTFVFDNNGKVTITSSGGTSTTTSTLGVNPTTSYSASSTEALFALPDLFVLKAGKTYTIKDVCISVFTGDSSTRAEYNTNALGISSHEITQITPTVDMHVKQARIYYKAGTQYDGQFVYEPMVCEGTDATFEPYQGTTIPISWQSEASTVYGGTLDVTTGVLTVTYKHIEFDGVTNGKKFTDFSTNTHVAIFYANDSFDFNLSNGAVASTDVLISNGVIATNMPVYKYSDSMAPTPCLGAYKSSTNFSYRVKMPTEVTDVASSNVLVKQWYDNDVPFCFVYPIAQPITYQLSPTEVTTLLGQNNIWADCGPSTVEYPCDTKMYVSNKMEEIENLRKTIAPIEDGDTASQLYGQGRYFFHNGDFCKAKTDILQNAQFTLNTNYEVTTVANELYDAINPFSV